MSRRLLTTVALLVLVVLAVATTLLYLSRSDETVLDSEREGIFGTLFPFRDSVTPTQTEDRVTDDSAAVVPRVRKVTDAPVSGARFVTGVSGTLAVRYVARETGHIYEVPVDSYSAVRLTNTTVPRSYEARWASASTTILRFINENDVPENFMGSFNATSTDQPLSGIFLKNYSRIALTESGGVLGLSTEATGSVLELFTPESGAMRTLFTSPLTSWIPLTAGTRVFVLSAPSGLAQGSLYEVEGGRLRSLIQNSAGLQVLVRNDGRRILASTGTVQNTTLFVTDGNGVRSNSPARRTLVDKCTWVRITNIVLCAIPTELPRGTYPDDWLLGRVHTNDELWLIDTVVGTQTLIFDPEEGGFPAFDMYRLSVSEDSTYALFIHKTDQTLWAIRLKE